ncbi:ankyrin-3-like [Stylophora pistillata]|uniref:ankyrin-3-like n=1 Tax=Stylophora pistillata TaxID=50429 RepID=UPI000C057CE8|nr:ankyrin-3-like [Stylophora pistillata]
MTKAVEIVLNEGVDINILGKSNRTPLLCASLSSPGEFIQTLIDLGANVNAQRTDEKAANGWTPLQCCVSNGFLSISQLLMDCGCDINLRNKFGKTSLYLAVKLEHKHLVKCLLESNAEVNMKYKENAKHRIYFVRGKNRGKPVWHYVLTYFEKVLESGWGKDPPESIREEIREIAITFHDIHSLTVLHFASKNGSPEIVELLVKDNADINGCDEDGFTPLHLAAIPGKVQVVKQLIELNADVNLKVGGKDAIDLAHMNEETEIEEFLKYKRSSPSEESDV